MSDTPNEEPQHRRPHSKPSAEPYLELDLTDHCVALGSMNAPLCDARDVRI